MANLILAETSASVSELKKNPMGTVAAGDGFPVAILNRNAPAFYCVPAKAYEALMDRLEDLELNAIANAREGQPVIKVKRERNAVYQAAAGRSWKAFD
jgi:antitoxin StbD